MNKQNWVKKYSPKSPKDEDFIVDKNTRAHILSFYESCDDLLDKINIIFYGPSGIGKTILCDYFLQLDDSNIKIQTSSFSNNNNAQKTIIKIKHWFQYGKGIIIDGIDEISIEYQRKLFDIFEKTEKDRMKNDKIIPGRYIFSCNDYNLILDQLKNYCVKIELKKFTAKQIYKKLKTISKSEDLNILDDAIELIALISDGDMRVAINNLQSIALFKINSKNPITKKTVEKVCKIPDTTKIVELFDKITSKKLKEALILLDEFNEFSTINTSIIVNIMILLLKGNKLGLSHEQTLILSDKIEHYKMYVGNKSNTNLQLKGLICKLVSD